MVVLLGILAAIALPSWFGFIESRNAASAANQVTADLRLAHSTARNRLNKVEARLLGTDCPGLSGSAGRRYQIVEFVADVAQTPRERCLPDGSKFVSVLPRTITFNSDGTAVNPAGNIGVARKSASAAEYTISINTQTSRVKVD
ncbi:type IV fimbrial biogenesis protein FimT [Rubrobacter radiotolerans DSM 5868]|nr:type IV fimbrial biogenesis protein FimT [Rubrobacter radiotolerans DSM 5868]